MPSPSRRCPAGGRPPHELPEDAAAAWPGNLQLLVLLERKTHSLHYSWTPNLLASLFAAPGPLANLLFSQKNKVTKVFLLVFGFNLHVKLARDIFLQGMIVMTDECIWTDKMVSVTDEGGKAIGI